jgi:hypothetical protein
MPRHSATTMRATAKNRPHYYIKPETGVKNTHFQTLSRSMVRKAWSQAS